MKQIRYFDRVTQQVHQEKVYGGFFLRLLYGKGRMRALLRQWLTRSPLFSSLYGAFQKSGLSRYKVRPFVRTFGVDATEFQDPIESFASFNAFFTRHLRPECRPIARGERVAILPADARYLAFPQIEKAGGFWIKGKQFSLSEFLQNGELAARYAGGSLVIARLCPVDYHRFHFPCDAVPRVAEEIPGALFSVNPVALRFRPTILSENKRVLTLLETAYFGTIACVEVGATCVGTIHQTFTPMKRQRKGDEKGYFSFGGSCMVLLFEPGKIILDADLIDYSARHLEVRGLMGQTLGRAAL